VIAGTLGEERKNADRKPGGFTLVWKRTGGLQAALLKPQARQKNEKATQFKTKMIPRRFSARER